MTSANNTKTEAMEDILSQRQEIKNMLSPPRQGDSNLQWKGIIMHSINARYYLTIATYATEEQRIKTRKKVGCVIPTLWKKRKCLN